MAGFDPEKRFDSHDTVFLICCPAHQRNDVKEELEKNGLTPIEAISRKDLIPGRDKAFVFVSEGIDFASSEDMGDFFLRLVEIFSKRKKDQRSFVQSNSRQDVLVSAASSLMDVPEMSSGEVSLFSFFLVDLVQIISN